MAREDGRRRRSSLLSGNVFMTRAKSRSVFGLRSKQGKIGGVALVMRPLVA